MRRTQALIAVGVAVAVAAVVVVVGMNSGGGEAAGAGDDASAGTTATTLPSGHPSVAVDQEEPAADADDAAGDADSSDPIAQLEQRSAEDPCDVAVLLDLGKACFMSQRLVQAEQAYSDVLAQEPDNALAQVGVAMVWHAQGDTKRAQASLRQVLDARPDDQEAHYSLAIVYFSAGRVGDAKAEWEKAARIEPSSTTGRRSQSFVDLLEDQESGAPQAN